MGIYYVFLGPFYQTCIMICICFFRYREREREREREISINTLSVIRRDYIGRFKPRTLTSLHGNSGCSIHNMLCTGNYHYIYTFELGQSILRLPVLHLGSGYLNHYLDGQYLGIALLIII
jgi:hypothetical protein